MRYKDANGDGTIDTDSDRVFVGTPFPKLQLGLNLNAAYKGFDVSRVLAGRDRQRGVQRSTRAARPATTAPTTTTPTCRPGPPKPLHHHARLLQGGGPSNLAWRPCNTLLQHHALAGRRQLPAPEERAAGLYPAQDR